MNEGMRLMMDSINRLSRSGANLADGLKQIEYTSTFSPSKVPMSVLQNLPLNQTLTKLVVAKEVRNAENE